MFNVVVKDGKVIMVAPSGVTVKTDGDVISVANKREFMRRFGKIDGAVEAWGLVVVRAPFAALREEASSAKSVAELGAVVCRLIDAVETQLAQLD